MKLQAELEARGMLYQFSDEKIFDVYEKGNQSLYFGVDPTADSMHLGNYAALMHALQYAKRGNTLILIVGGATGMVGDPGGKDAERTFLDEESLQHNVQSIRAQLASIAERRGELIGTPIHVEVINNLDFYSSMSYIDFLRDIGKHMTVNTMMNKDTVRKRIQDPDKSISYTEFSYMLMQGFDYLTLFRQQKCRLQVGASDQRGNMITGIEMIRKLENEESYVVTCPLMTDSTGKKFGKSAGNALRLDPNKTTPYAMYQYFLNTNDEDVEKYLKGLTLLTLEEIDKIVTQHQENVGSRYGQKQLAHHVLFTVFGEAEALQAAAVTDALFGKGDVHELLEKDQNGTMQQALHQATGGVVLEEGTYRILELLVQSGLAGSNGEAKKLIASGSVNVQGQKIQEVGYEHQHTTSNAIGGTLLKKGKKAIVYIK